MSKMKRKKEKILHEAIVPRSVIEHTKSFTAPRGRMEMGGLLEKESSALFRILILRSHLPY